MITIFIDESGDLGFSENSSKYFIISLLITKNPIKIRRCLRKFRDTIPKSKKKINELHWNSSSQTIKKKGLKKLNECEFDIQTLIVDKSTIYHKLTEKKDKLYHYLSKLIIEEAILDEKNVQIIFDKRSTNKLVRDDLSTYILNLISEQGEFIKASIKHVRSEDERGIQAVDFICGAFSAKYELDNADFVKIIQEHLKTEKCKF